MLALHTFRYVLYQTLSFPNIIVRQMSNLGAFFFLLFLDSRYFHHTELCYSASFLDRNQLFSADPLSPLFFLPSKAPPEMETFFSLLHRKPTDTNVTDFCWSALSACLLFFFPLLSPSLTSVTLSLSLSRALSSPPSTVVYDVCDVE